MDMVLVHPFFRPVKKLLYFYDGFVVANNGVVRIPYDGERSTRWAKQCWIRGYNRTEDGRALPSFRDFEEDFIRSAKSAKDKQGTDTRG